ncbi:MAG: FtsX-like permease family protein, partial [Terriglobia bacterium]
ADVLFFGSGFHAVSPGYFSAMGIPLLGGREFTDEDRHNSKSVAIVNETFARQYWPGENPVGKEIFENYPKTTPVLRVVGEVRDTIDLSLAELPRPELYQPYTQYFLAAFAGALVAKTRTPASTAVAMQKAIRSVDPEAPISQIRTMDQVLARNRAGNRFYLLLVGVFALLALVLAAAGIASTVSYAVSQRRHEVGIRMALGAQRGAILGLIAGQTLKLVVAGIALGLAGSFMLTRFVASELYKVSPTDPLTLALVSLMLMAIGVLSSLVPARRATRIDPAETLRAL